MAYHSRPNDADHRHLMPSRGRQTLCWDSTAEDTSVIIMRSPQDMTHVVLVHAVAVI